MNWFFYLFLNKNFFYKCDGLVCYVVLFLVFFRRYKIDIGGLNCVYKIV